jgi:transcriptional regulator with XRE-family HTH domain
MSNTSNSSKIQQFVIDFVRKLRDDRNITQEEIANVIGVSQAYIANIESSNGRAKYNLKHIDLLADYYGLSPKDFLPEKSTIR